MNSLAYLPKPHFKYKTSSSDRPVITGSPRTTHNGIPVARKGDQVMCKKCKKMTVIVSGDASFVVDGAPLRLISIEYIIEYATGFITGKTDEYSNIEKTELPQATTVSIKTPARNNNGNED